MYMTGVRVLMCHLVSQWMVKIFLIHRSLVCELLIHGMLAGWWAGGAGYIPAAPPPPLAQLRYAGPTGNTTHYCNGVKIS